MKSFCFILFLLGALHAQSQVWNTDFEKAQNTAQLKDQSILLVFSGSDWCAPCIKLEKSIFSSETFITESEQWVLVKADFPKKKNNALSETLRLQNEKLAEKYNIEGNFPLVVILDQKGKVLGKIGYKNVTPEAYISELKSFTNLNR